MTNQIANPHLGIGNQARSILALLECEPAFAEYKDGHYDVFINTHAWYNGREKGVALTMMRPKHKGSLVVVFGENRNSDDIFVDFWTLETLPPMNGPTVQDMPEGAYKARKFFKYGEAGKAADHIYILMRLQYTHFTAGETAEIANQSS